MSGITKENLLLLLLGLTAIVSGIFITKDECPTNEEYLLCGSACPFNCSNPEGPVTCNVDCAEGCFCKSGFLRDNNGTCVSSDTCSGGKASNSTCEDNEEFLQCGSSCAPTCSQPEPVPCSLACSMGCFCKAGFVRDGNNKCVPLDQCPIEQCFNDNEVYDTCQGACESTCEDPEPICSTICSGGCICAPGLLRNASGDCVPVDKCPVNNNATDPGLLGKYLDVINRILHLDTSNVNVTSVAV